MDDQPRQPEEYVDTAGHAHDPHRAGHVDFICDDNIKRFGVCLLLAIAWSASMGDLPWGGLLLILAAFAATGAFMLPVGTPPNAIVFFTGAVTIVQMARSGLVPNIIGIVLITLFCYLLGGFALGVQF